MREFLQKARMGKRRLETAKSVYNYHNLGVGIFPQTEEKTPYGYGERYNFDRMYMMVSNYDFTRKNVLDLGCNSGWFCLQAKLLGAAATVGVDYAGTGLMGSAIQYARAFEDSLRLGLQFIDADLERIDLNRLARDCGVKLFHAAFLLSTLHHISSKRELFSALFDIVDDVIFYEDHEFWNDLVDEHGAPIPVLGEGYRYGWNEDLSWQRKMGALESYEPRVIESFRSTWRRETLLLDQFAEIRLLGFSEKRRPVLALYKHKAET